jgi:hypothetical protein
MAWQLLVRGIELCPPDIMTTSKLKPLLLLTLGMHLLPGLANARLGGPPAPPNNALIVSGNVEYVVLGGYVGYLDLLHAEYGRAVLYNENRHYTYFDPLRGGSDHIPTFETPIYGFGWGRHFEPTTMSAPGLRPPPPPHTPSAGHAIAGIGGPGGLGLAAAPLVGEEDPPAVTPVPEPGAYLMLASGLALLHWRLRRRSSPAGASAG